MRKFAIVTIAAVLTISAGQAFAESEGNADPFSFSAEQTALRGPAFVTETGADSYPIATGNANRGSSLAQLEANSGSEMPLQTANSHPVLISSTAIARAQTQRRALEAGVARPAA